MTAKDLAMHAIMALSILGYFSKPQLNNAVDESASKYNITDKTIIDDAKLLVQQYAPQLMKKNKY